MSGSKMAKRHLNRRLIATTAATALIAAVALVGTTTSANAATAKTGGTLFSTGTLRGTGLLASSTKAHAFDGKRGKIRGVSKMATYRQLYQKALEDKMEEGGSLLGGKFEPMSDAYYHFRIGSTIKFDHPYDENQHSVSEGEVVSKIQNDRVALETISKPAPASAPRAYNTATPP